MASASHIAVGAEESLATEPREAPNDEDRSVPSDKYELGTSTEDECYTPSAEVSTDEAEKASSAHGFCGMLLYHEGGELEQQSPVDQDLRGPIGTFDVVRSHTYSQGAGTCMPFCEELPGATVEGVTIGGGDNPVGDPTFNATHEAGSTVGVTDGPGTAYEEEDGRGYGAGVTARHATPTRAIQDTAPIWEMDGWWWPSATSTFIAFIEDGEGNPIDDERLQSIVDAKKDNGDLHPQTEATVCGYTPDFQFTTVSPDAAGLNCEFEFSYEHTDEGTDPTSPKFDGYEDSCETTTYVCGAVNGPAWYSQDCVCIGLTDPEPPGVDNVPATGDGSPLAGPEGQTDYIRWHFVIAPHNSACGGAQEPGFSFSPDGNYAHPYLAHDIDVWTTAASLENVEATGAVPELLDYSDAVAESYTGQVSDALGDPTEAVPGDLPIPAETSMVVREDKLEPNNDGPIRGLDDTSRSFEEGELSTDDLFRSLTGKCEALFAQEEPETVDPWVDYLDSRAQAVQDVDVSGTYASDERVIRRIGPYGTSDETQDASNRPGPTLFQTDGKVGMFTDKDDDGEYDQIESGIKYNAQNTLASGAYPMIWNMWADQAGQPHEDQGCQLGPDTTMSMAADDLGYGVNTSLVQAVYLNEPTAFYENLVDGPVEYSDGNNIFVMMSQAARVLYDEDVANANPVDTRVEDLVETLKLYVTEDLNRDTPDVHFPGEDLGTDATFTDQCSGRTGNFASNLQFVHDCTFDCTGDTIVTMYTFEIDSVGGTLEGSQYLPTFEPGDEGPYVFGQGQHTWYDVDPFDNDPNRSDDEENPPPNPDAGALGEGQS